MNYIITEEELTSLEKTGNPSYRKSVEYVIGRIRSRPVEPRQVILDELLTELANEICDHCINPDKFDLRDHTKECLLRRISNRLTGTQDRQDTLRITNGQRLKLYCIRR